MRHYHSRGAKVRSKMDRDRHHLSRDQLEQAPIERCVWRRNSVRGKRSTNRFRERKAPRRARQIPVPTLGIVIDRRASAKRRRRQRRRSRRRWFALLLRNGAKRFSEPSARRRARNEEGAGPS